MCACARGTDGSCCCGCSEGGGQVVFKARSIEGPWNRQQHADINCRNATAAICGGYSRRDDNYDNLVRASKGTVVLARGCARMLALHHAAAARVTPGRDRLSTFLCILTRDACDCTACRSRAVVVRLCAPASEW